MIVTTTDVKHCPILIETGSSSILTEFNTVHSLKKNKFQSTLLSYITFLGIRSYLRVLGRTFPFCRWNMVGKIFSLNKMRKFGKHISNLFDTFWYNSIQLLLPCILHFACSSCWSNTFIQVRAFYRLFSLKWPWSFRNFFSYGSFDSIEYLHLFVWWSFW